MTAAEAVQDFDRAREAFEVALRRAPDAALRFRPQAEEYALGGLVVHVTDVLRRYTALLDMLRAEQWQPLVAPSLPTSDRDQQRIRDGFPGEERARVLDDMRASHAALADAARATADDFERQAQVTFENAAQPYPTSAADVVGWVRDHYAEHTQQVSDLVTAWAASTR